MLCYAKGGPDDHTGIAAPPFIVTPPPPAPKSWVPVFRQTMPDLFQPGEWSRNPSETTAPTFSNLAGLEALRDKKTRGFELKLRWADPDGKETLAWKQTSNPFANKSKTVEGFELISGPGNSFGGLAYNGQQALLDGEPGQGGTWFFAVGYTGAGWGSGLSIPAYINRAGPKGAGAQCAELHARNKKGAMQLVFRQTLPHLWSLSTLRVNAADPHNETFAILDSLEDFRAADGKPRCSTSPRLLRGLPSSLDTFPPRPFAGKLELQLTWPDKYNTWRQTSNPVTATGAGVDGYAPVDVRYSSHAFGGLERNTAAAGTNESLLDGSIGIDEWFYSIGYQGNDWSGQGPSIPAMGGIGAQQAELFVAKSAA